MNFGGMELKIATIAGCEVTKRTMEDNSSITVKGFDGTVGEFISLHSAEIEAM
jgi:phosphohistidine swiveling domain-containing protein